MMLCAAMSATVMPFSMPLIMMAAMNMRIKLQLAGKECIHRLVSRPKSAAVQFNPCLGKCSLSAAADPAANQHIHIQRL